MRAVIFLGPTLPVATAQSILDAVYLPPAAQSDVLSAVTTYRPDVVGLIDGVFAQSLSVWHKEILFALNQGIRVYGASSMGALRAAEIDRFGMVGVGEVYRRYAALELTDDDEVAVAHGLAEDGYRPLSEPMVNVRATLERAVADGVLDAPTADRIVALAKAIYFPERTYPAILQRARTAGVSSASVSALRAYVAASAVDLKRDDALLLLRTIRDLPDPLPPLEPRPALTRSHLFEAQYQRDRTVRHRDVDVPLEAIAHHAALRMPDFAELAFQAMNRELALVLARLLGVTVADEDVDVEERRFRFRRGLREDAALSAWLCQNDLGQQEFRELMRSLAVCRRLHRWLRVQLLYQRNTRLTLDELRLHDAYRFWAESAADEQRVLEAAYPALREIPVGDVTWETLVVEHLRATGIRVPLPMSEWAEEVGFGSADELRVRLWRERLLRQHRQTIAADVLAATTPVGDDAYA